MTGAGRMNSTTLLAGLLRIYRGLWRYSYGARRMLLLALTLLALSEIVKLAMPWLFGKAIDTVQRSGWAGIDHAVLLTAGVLGCLLASWLLHGPGRILERNVSIRVRAAYVGEMNARVLDAPLGWHRARNSVDTTQLLTQSSDALSTFAQSQYIYLQNAISLMGPIAAIASLSPWTGAVAAAGYAVLAAVSVAFDRVLLNIRIEQLRVARRYFAALADALDNILTVFALRRRSGVSAWLDRKLADTFLPERREILFNEVKWATIDIISSTLVYVEVGIYIWLHGRDASLAGGIALGGAFMIYEYAKRINGVVATMVTQFAHLNNNVAGFSASEVLMDIRREPRIEHVHEPATAVWRHIAVRGLGHRYQDGAAMVLRDASCSLERGKRYALVGQSGSGKSTLMTLLAGLEAPARGSIECDDAAVTPLELRAMATLVPQGVQLFEGSLAENLGMGAAVAAPDMIEALDTACAREFALTQEADLSCAVNEAGKNWSGGQRQRIALARGLLAARHCSLLLLDEPGASLDAATERQLLAQVFSAFPTACIVVSIHRLHLIDLFDAVVVVEGGCVADSGGVSELTQRSAQFRRLLASARLTEPAAA